MKTLQKNLRLITTLVVMTLIAFPAFAAYTAPKKASPALAADKAPTQVLITNVRVFDGTSNKLTDKTNVLIENNLIKEVSATAKASKDATVIDGGGRVLMPGLIDAHAHLSMVENPMFMTNNRLWDWRGAVMGMEAQRYVMRGFTTVRDVGGPVFGLKAAIDEGRAEGPRIYPSGGPISQTSGHGDFRNLTTGSNYFSGAPQSLTDMGYVYLADGVPEVSKNDVER